MLLHPRHNLPIREFVSGLDVERALGKHLGSAETLLEFQLGLARSKDQKGLGLFHLTDDLIVVLLKALAVPFLVSLLAPAILLPGITRMRSDFSSNVFVVTRPADTDTMTALL